VRVDGSEIAGDAVIVSLGADLDPEAVPGLASAGHNLYTLPGALGARRALADFAGGRVVILTAAPAYKCPAAPYEAAMLIRDHLQRRSGGAATVDIFAAEPGPMTTAGPEVSAAVRGMVEERGIAYHPNHQVEAVDPATRRLHFKDAAPADYDLLICAAAPGSVGREAELAWLERAAGSVDAHTLKTEWPVSSR
jgi:sulfide:quinone oxidoreductase